MLNKLFFVFSFFVFANLFGLSEELSFSRSDGSQAAVYLNTPENVDSFPMVVYIDGSIMQSVKNNFSVLSYLFDQKKIGIVAIEKRGITKDSINLDEFLAHDTYENRLKDYRQLVYQLHSIAPNWNGQIIFIGSSEGGKIAPKLSLEFPHITRGTILIGSGGGLSFGEEIKYQIKQIAIESDVGFDDRELDELIDYQYSIMLSRPKSLETFYEKTFQWFASYLKYDLLEDLLQINTPVLMIHGALDAHIPVVSADLVKESFDAAGKENLDYVRYEDLGHSISKRMDVFMLLLLYSYEHFQSGAIVGL